MDVREKLLGVTGLVRVPAPGFEVLLLPNFLNPEECGALIKKIDSDLQPSIVLAETLPDPEYRTSKSCNLDPKDPSTRAVEAKLAKLIPIDPAHGEAIQGQRYEVGQQFKPHYDWFYTDQPYWPEQDRVGGQRTWTAMIFLNAPEAGGQTFFTKAGIKISPRTGTLLIWNNLDESGAPNLATLHQGMPVGAGVKYVVTKWYRERRWGY